ncbi:MULTISPECIES: LCP family protein [Streptomycetaceae]|uniref:LytR/CpsA/Psr regulator C-terminal domain-containing protein n=1 Tax=Streptantibioticus cattleyicolor (strain ATCC 35852 / DSM 46488 / JCM 4925 / NBRC 14057 / NRRL 8057) TaxID=1003195 RepID=F8JPU0_STREN|nr:LCP family protein [Streptantibioticus cattleyicolor]AEW93998.1 hypothetical protein SCATT_16270 [Streptantibioticus cattleyicolor NRRL 8057 = DSM 46488]MYS58671.1 hypothetical protein [Streptomyces sp. SID5468]CCB74342.1 Membrane protein [Streptantibioticus cattleyicolor NRRL 8057 = DSM 46488]
MSDAHPGQRWTEDEQRAAYARQPYGGHPGPDPYAQGPAEGYDPYAAGYGTAAAPQPGADGGDPAPGQPGYPHQQAPQGYVPHQYAPPGQSPYGYSYDSYDPYQQQPEQPYQQSDAYGGQQQYQQPYQQGYDGYGQVPRPRQEAAPGQPADHHQPPEEPAHPGPAEDDEGFHTEQFAFIDEEDEQAEDVIDWLKFTESRTERRDERKRRGRKRLIALAVVAVLAVGGGVTYLWQAGKLPGTGTSGTGKTAASGAQKRDVIVVHLRQVDSNDSSTALLVGNETTGKGSTVLLPGSLAVTTDSGTTTLAKSVVDDGAGPTRDALGTLLGADIKGTWRLDTPYLEILVESVGGITLDADATVKGGGKTLVTPGKGKELNGQAAVAYATYRAPGEPQTKQLARFGQVMQAVLTKLPSDAATATKIVDSLGAIPDPSLTDSQLGATLAHLADEAKGGDYATTLLPVQPDGTLSPQATDGVVKDVLGGTVKNSDPSGTPRISVRNATGDTAAANTAQAAVVNSGYTYLDGGTAPRQSASQVIYSSAARAATARELAKTLGLPASAVTKGNGAGNADITVVLGADYHKS